MAKKQHIIEMMSQDAPQLRELLSMKREKLQQLYFELQSGKVKNLKELREVRKDIARVLTFIRQKAS